MVGGWIGRLFGGSEQRVDSRISADLGRLNKAKAGLADKAIRYVLTGEGGEVLSTLSTIDPALVFGRGWSSSDQIRFGRATWLVRTAPAAETALRYAEIIAALDRNTVELPGFADTPPALRAFVKAAAEGFQEAESYPRKMYTGAVVVTPAFLADLATCAGAKLVDLWGLLFAFNTRWQYGEREGRIIRQALDFVPLVRAHPDTVLAAARRLSADGRADLIEQLGKWKVLDLRELRQVVLSALGDSAKSVREAARAVLKLEAEAALFADLAPLLGSGQSQVRQSAAEILATLKVAGVSDLFTTHLEQEKTSAVRTVIETALRVQSMPSGTNVVSEDSDGRAGYVALDGSFVTIPPMKPVEPVRTDVLGQADIAALDILVRAENARRQEFNKTSQWKQQPLADDTARKAVAFLNGGPSQKAGSRGFHDQFVVYQTYEKWLKPALARMPTATALTAMIKLTHTPSTAFKEQGWGPAAAIIDYVQTPDADFRLIDKLFCDTRIDFHFGGYTTRGSRQIKPGDVLRSILDSATYGGGGMALGPIPPDAVWPYLAEHLDIFAEAFGLKAPGTPAPDKLRAVELLKFLPKTPAEFLGPLLDIATGTGKTGRDSARSLLKGAPGLTGIVCSLLKDGRQDTRAGAARWLGEIGDPTALPALTEALKTEKSEVARAGMLGALRALGAPIDHYVGPKALISEAQTLLKKAKTDKLEWLLKTGLPALQFADGSRVPDEVPRAWVVLAAKLKQPGGNALFDIYLDQLAPASAQKLSTHLLDAWINYDTETASHEEANAYALANAQSRHLQLVKWLKDYTVEKAFRDLYNEKRGAYLNSGAEAKGLFGLAVRAAPSHAAAQVRSYLKHHGSRTAQTSAMLEMLSSMADPVTLQVVISAATRLKQKTVQAHAAALVQAVAEQRNWTMAELADRTVPTAGLNDDGDLELPCGPEAKPYAARLDAELKFALFNPDGKAVSALPAGDDEQTKASKSLLSVSKKELAQAISMQSARLYEALCSGRTWPTADWQRDFREHPLMARLTERIIWQGLDAEGEALATFRPMPEGDLSDASDDAVDPSAFASVRLAHAALLPDSERLAWITHLKDYEVKTLFAQFSRPVLGLTDAQKGATQISDRKGWITDTFTFRGNATKLGYQRGEAMDGGYFSNYFKTFSAATIFVDIAFSGNGVPEENVTAVMFDLSFHRLSSNGRAGKQLPLKEVPPVLLSECWNDYYDIVAKASFDPQWEKKSPW